ncbi:MAG TPA: hypothetical protein PLX66_00455 [Bacilli bacterium]|nr:hypothetical protein [Bacilli bacterium]
MDRLNDLLQELGISKVRLAKYLGVSRQMVYNYLEMDSISKWPKEKKLLFLKLLNLQDGNDDTIKEIKVTADYIMEVEGRLNQGVKDFSDLDSCFDLKGLKKEEQELIVDITAVLKEKMLDEKHGKQNFIAFTYLYHLLQAYDNVPEIKYIFGYMSKATGFTNPNQFTFDEDKQFIFEGILYSALNLYNSGGTSKSRLIDSHKRFVQEIEQRNEEKLSRTQQLNTIKVQALKELNYTTINEQNAAEVLEKMAEIEARKV